MPLYDFECLDHGHKFEKLQRMSDSPPPCPHKPEQTNGIEPEPCGSETKRLISASNFHLKGGGWEADGYS